LRQNPGVNAARLEIDINVAELFHHYYLDTRGHRPPDPDPTLFEHLSFFLPQKHLRLRGAGFGTYREFRRNRSNELGHAFCRWFLSKHLNIHYFAHFEEALTGPLINAFAEYHFRRTSVKADLPDYFCAEDVDRFFLAEAKGRRGAISFDNVEFDRWRLQFASVELVRGATELVSIKGHIVAMRFAAETDGPKVQTTLYAEDPKTPGERDAPEGNGLGGISVRLHYADIADKLSQRILSASLSQGFLVPDEIRFPGVIWELRLGPWQGRRFVGGFFNPKGQTISFAEENGGAVLQIHPFSLDQPRPTFFGLEEGVFKGIAEIARRGDDASRALRPIEEMPFIDSALSILRDGSALGPLDYFRAVGQFSF
jgi:hypothetical protein